MKPSDESDNSEERADNLDSSSTWSLFSECEAISPDVEESLLGLSAACEDLSPPSKHGKDGGTYSLEAHDHFNEPTTDWRSIYTATFLSFCGSVQFSLYFSSLWPFLQQVDATSSEAFFGYIVACYSLGMMIGSPLMGYCSNRMHRVRPLLLVGLALMLAGNLIYVSVQFWPSRWTMGLWLWGVERKVEVSRKFLLLLGRFVTGLGSSNVSLLKAYASTASLAEDRSRAIAFVTGGLALGMTMGPSFQLLFTPISYPGLPLYILSSDRGFWLSMYTASAYMACVMNLIGASTVIFFYRENDAGLEVAEDWHKKRGDSSISHHATIPPTTKLRSDSHHSTSVHSQHSQLPRYDRIATMVCYITRFTQMFVTTNLETIGSPMAAAMYAWSRNDVVFYNSVAHGLLGAMSFATYMFYIVLRLDKVMNFRRCCMLALGFLILFHVLTYAGYPIWPAAQLSSGSGLVNANSNSSESSNLSVTMLGEAEQLGCDERKFTWCRSVHPPPAWFFYTAYVLCIGFAFPNINVALNTLFSRIIGPRRQGTEQGFLQMFGASARMLGPIAISTLFVANGPQIAWIAEVALIGLTLLLWLLLHSRMVPLEERWSSGVLHLENNLPSTTRIGMAKKSSRNATNTGYRTVKDIDDATKPILQNGGVMTNYASIATEDTSSRGSTTSSTVEF